MSTTLNEIQEAVVQLKQGQVIAYPTEAIYGLGCDPYSMEAIATLLQIKQRSIQKGFILVAAHWEQVESLVELIPPPQLARVLATWPGPITWTFPASSEVPHWITGKHKTIALRISAHPTIRRLCEAFGGPIVSTSANVEGAPPVRDYRTMKMTFANKVAKILPGIVGGRANPTEIRDAITGEIIRP